MTKEFLSPNEVEDLKAGKNIIVDNGLTDDTEEVVDEAKEEIKPNVTPIVQNKAIAVNNAGKVKIDFESNGRFDMPSALHFAGYKIDHVDQFALVNEENIFETLVSVVEDLKQEDQEVSIENMLIEEFFEALIGIKSQFNTPHHIHRWLCDCQNKEDKNTQIINEKIIDLRKLKFRSIETADEIYKEMVTEAFEIEGVFSHYIKLKYGQEATESEFTKEEEIKQVKIDEPYSITDGVDVYKFRLLRVKDLIVSSRYITKKYSSKIKAVRAKQIHNVKAEELKQIKEEELEKLEIKKGQEFVRTLRRVCLTEFNGRPLNTLEEKLQIELPLNIVNDSTDFLERIKFGVYDKQDFECPICGYSEQRLLHLEFDFIEFIPIKSDTANELRNITRGNIFMGV